MKGKDILNKYPLSAKAINLYFTGELMKSVDKEQIPEEFREYVLQKGVEDEQIAVFLDVNPRNIFDMLDGHGIIIQILYTEEDGFGWQIDNPDMGYHTRKDAERDGMLEGVKLLEKKLQVKSVK